MSKPYEIVKNLEQLEEQTEAYFNKCDDDGTPYTVPGYAFFLGYATRDSVPRLAKDPNYGLVIKRAKLKIETQRNIQLITEGNTPGKVFDLKNNFGWKEQSEVKLDGQLSITAEIYKARKRTEEEVE